MLFILSFIISDDTWIIGCLDHSGYCGQLLIVREDRSHEGTKDHQPVGGILRINHQN